MGQETGIAWCDHVDRNATGRVLGGYKNAARRTGCTLEGWFQKRASGLSWCFRCREWLPKIKFAVDRSRRGGFHSLCKPCMSEACTASRYGMSFKDLKAFKVKHGPACGICGEERPLVIDHDHKTGRVRGMLCYNCNSAIGKLKEDPALFSAALKYLETSRG